MNAQRRIERQVAAMHVAIAARLRQGDITPLQLARANLERWTGQFGGELPPAYAEWVALLDAGLGAVLAVLEGDTEEAIRQRSNSPFAGALTAQERWQIMRHAA
jgi:hypothetical protein